MSLRITGAMETRQIFRNVNRFLESSKPMEGVVADIKDLIQKKTRSGLDYRGRRFAPYSDSYAKKKKKTRVDLTDTSLMLESLDTKVITPRHGRIFVKPRKYTRKKGKARADMVAQIHTTGTGNKPQREFMNITKNALTNIVKIRVDAPIMRILGRR